MPELRSDISPGHEHFRVMGGGPVRPDAEIDCRERAANQLVHHHYRVRAFEPNQRLYLASLPTTGGSRVWQQHQRHEMARMKTLLEQGPR